MGTTILGVQAVVPAQRVALADVVGAEDAPRVAQYTGVSELRRAPATTTFADLAAEAANRLFARLGARPADVDAIICVTQTPDYLSPATACTLQSRLGVGTRCATFDVNQGCAGYPYGLAIAHGWLAGGLARRVLLLVGDTVSHLVAPGDRATAPLFGDAAIATLLERSDERNDLLGFSLGTDGEGWSSLIVPVGEARYPDVAAFRERADPALAEVEHPACVHMDGDAIFAFTLGRVPGLLRDTLAAGNVAVDDVDAFYFHQANAFILAHLVKKMKLPAEKCPTSIAVYGNTAGASPALTACHVAADDPQGRTVAFLGFGVGFSWAGAVVRLAPGVLAPVAELA